jgi:hypothetical protein
MSPLSCWLRFDDFLFSSWAVRLDAIPALVMLFYIPFGFLGFCVLSIAFRPISRYPCYEYALHLLLCFPVHYC